MKKRPCHFCKWNLQKIDSTQNNNENGNEQLYLNINVLSVDF